MVKNLPADAGDTRDIGSIPGREDPLEDGMATHSSILAWRIPMDRGAWQAAVSGLHRADTTERLTLQDLLSAWQSKAFPCFFPFNSHNTIRIHISK